MQNTLTGFDKLIQEHESIRANTRLISNLADDFLTLASLQTNSSQLTLYQINYLSERRLNFKRAINSLSDGLIDHDKREEEMIRPLVGDPLIQAIKRECQNVLQKLSELDWIVMNTGPVGILFNSAFIKLKVDAMCQKLAANCSKKDAILELLKSIPSEPLP
jgi:hypothetical protein